MIFSLNKIYCAALKKKISKQYFNHNIIETLALMKQCELDG